MAVSISVIDYTKTTITVRIEGLTYTANQYRFQFDCHRINGTGTTRFSPDEWYGDRFYGSSGSNYYQDWTFPKLLPNNKYEIQVWAEYPKDSGTWYNFGPIYQTTSNISKPGGEYIPSYYPDVRHQWVWDYGNAEWDGQAGTCVPITLSVCMDILEYNERGTTGNHYSIGWIYGNRKPGDYEGSGQYMTEALANCKVDGSPRYERIDIEGWGNFYPDNLYFDSSEAASPEISAEDMVDEHWDKLEHEARVQKIDYTSTLIDFYNCQAIAAAITANGCCTVGLLTSSKWDACTGELDDPVNTTYGGAHAAVLIGWGEVSGVDCWICQNGWDTSWGDDGICYIPMDYALTVAAPSSTMALRWFYDCYEIKNVDVTTSSSSVTIGTPQAELLARYQTSSGGTAGLTLYWDKKDYCDFYKLRYKISGGSYSYVDDIGNFVDASEADYASDESKSYYQLSGLAYGTTYLVSVAGRNDYNNQVRTGSYLTDAEATTAPKRPTQSKVSSNNTQIVMSVAVSSGNWSFCRVYYKLSTDGSYTNYITITYPTTQGTISGLTPGATYNIKTASFYTKDATDIQCRNSDGTLGYSSEISVTMSSRPSDWLWTNGTDSVVAGDIVMDNSNKRIKILTAVQWNNFCDRIDEFRTYKSLGAGTFTAAVQYNGATATQANQARTAINDMSPPTAVPSAVSAGGKITNEFIDGLVASLNSIV